MQQIQMGQMTDMEKLQAQQQFSMQQMAMSNQFDIQKMMAQYDLSSSQKVKDAYFDMVTKGIDTSTADAAVRTAT